MNEAILIIVNLASVVGLIVYFSIKGTPGAASETIAIFKDRDTEQKKLIDQLRDEVRTNSLALATLQGVVSEKDKKIQEYLEIFRGNSPEEVEYRSDMRKFTEGVAIYMRDSAEIFDGMKTFMTQLNEKAQTNQEKNIAQEHLTTITAHMS